jgi:hypothetical protein
VLIAEEQENNKITEVSETSNLLICNSIGYSYRVLFFIYILCIKNFTLCPQNMEFLSNFERAQCNMFLAKYKNIIKKIKDIKGFCRI